MELPPKKAEITNVEALLKRTIDDLTSDQEHRKKNNLEDYNKIEQFLEKVKLYSEGK